MTKERAIQLFGDKVIEKAQSLYQTQTGKVFWAEDCIYENDIPLDTKEQNEYIGRAHWILSHDVKLTEEQIAEIQRNNS